jgi:hypothetical protein
MRLLFDYKASHTFCRGFAERAVNVLEIWP